MTVCQGHDPRVLDHAVPPGRVCVFEDGEDVDGVLVLCVGEDDGVCVRRYCIEGS